MSGWVNQAAKTSAPDVASVRLSELMKVTELKPSPQTFSIDQRMEHSRERRACAAGMFDIIGRIDD